MGRFGVGWSLGGAPSVWDPMGCSKGSRGCSPAFPQAEQEVPVAVCISLASPSGAEISTLPNEEGRGKAEGI